MAVTSANAASRLYIVPETTYGQMIAPANSNRASAGVFSFTANQGKIISTDRTGRTSEPKGKPGIRTASWQGDFELRTPAAAGGKPDADPFFVAAFGIPAVVVAATSATYIRLPATTDDPKSFTIYEYIDPSDAMHQALPGSVINKAVFKFPIGANANVSVTGESIWVDDAYSHDTADATARGGLAVGAFPTEPATPVVNGNPIDALTGTFTINGVGTFSIESCDLEMSPNWSAKAVRLFAGGYPGLPTRTIYTYRLSNLVLILDNSASMKSLIAKTKDKVNPYTTCILECGVGAGNRANFAMAGVQLEPPKITDGGDGSKRVTFPSMNLFESAIGQQDTLALKFY